MAIPGAELAELVATALTLTRGRTAHADAARDAFTFVGARLADYFRANGLVVMRPAPLPPAPAPEMRPVRVPTGAA